MRDNNSRFPKAPEALSEEQFVECFGGVYEHSPWIARETWRRGLTVESRTAAGLAAAMAKTVASAPRARRLELIRAHPELAGRAAKRGDLTAASCDEQAGAGIAQCTEEEVGHFQSLNAAYRARFGFPFVMAVRNSNREEILRALRQRLENPLETEFEQALRQIDRIAHLRLQALADAGPTP